LQAGKWTSELHDEVYVFDSGRWTKNKELYASVQSATWDDVILDPVMKADLITDVLGFFDNQALYAEYSVPWKRGIIFHGTPGNGKTISIKALIASLSARQQPIPSLYVKSLEAMQGREFAVRVIFSQARAFAPCLLVFEDLDSLLTDKVRSYFLNEIDGLESNDGIMMIGSTNHLEKLDPAISKRPSRFDRKYNFKTPSLPERISYAQYWGSKITRNKDIEWEDGVADAIGRCTEGFSFAYLKELFLTSLFSIASSRLRKSTAGGETYSPKSDEVDATTATNRHTYNMEDETRTEPLGIPRNLAANAFLSVVLPEISTLRDEMESSGEGNDVRASVSMKVPSALPARVHVRATRIVES